MPFKLFCWHKTKTKLAVEHSEYTATFKFSFIQLWSPNTFFHRVQFCKKIMQNPVWQKQLSRTCGHSKTEFHRNVFFSLFAWSWSVWQHVDSVPFIFWCNNWPYLIFLLTLPEQICWDKGDIYAGQTSSNTTLTTRWYVIAPIHCDPFIFFYLCKINIVHCLLLELQCCTVIAGLFLWGP